MYFLIVCACGVFCLWAVVTDIVTADVPYVSTRNFQGPIPVRTYQGTDLLAAAVKKCGSQVRFVDNLRRQVLSITNRFQLMLKYDIGFIHYGTP
jgi:hypothetical protein